ncbi:MAG: prolyl oligopeptidase [Halobacteriales archaeon]|jgi:prolyl oligopeptidase
MTTPPDTERRPVTDAYHGDEIVDPYRWLEADTEEVSEWVEAQNQYADPHLETDRRETLRPRFERLAEVTSYNPVVVRGGWYFQRIEGPEEDHPVLYVRDGLDGERRVLVDPNRWDETRSLSWYAPSHEGDRVAYGATEGGDEQYDVHVLNVETGEEIDRLDGVGRTNPGMFAWDPGGDGFYYVATGGPDDGSQLEKELRHHEIADGDPEGGTAADPVLLEHDDPHVWPVLWTDRETGTLVLGLSEMSGGTDLHVAVETDGSETDVEFEPVLTGYDAPFQVSLHRGTVYLKTEYDAPKGQVLGCSLDRFREAGRRDGELDPDDLDVVVPEREGTLESITLAADGLVAHHQRDATSRLRRYDLDGGAPEPIDLPDNSTVAGLTANRDVPEAFYLVQSFDRPPSVVRAALDDGTIAVLDRVDVDVDVPDDLVVSQEWFESTDGADVPVFVVHREGIDRNGDNPAVLYGYGGFRNSVTPIFRRFYLPFLADGGVYAQVCARGGREFGEAWHEQGMLEHKQHTFDDFVGAAEHLVDRGYTRPDRLAVAGGSNGGLSVGAVVTQRPDLFGAAFCAVPLLDMLRFHAFLLGESWTTEYGSPEDPEAYEWLKAYSPYHNVEPDREYPPILFKTAVGDTRVHPSHARKMTARMQHEAAGGPFLLRTMTDTGHGLGKPTSMIVREQLDQWTFLYENLDVDV